MYLTDEQKAFYKEQGFLLLDNVYSDAEIEECSNDYDKLFAANVASNTNLEATWSGEWNNKNKGETTVLSIHNLQCHSATFTKMLLNKNLLDATSELMNSPNILLHHTKAHIKPPEIGSPFPTHQDYHYFPYKNDSMVAIFIHLDDSDPENGGLAIFPGSHKLGPLENKSTVPTHFYVDQQKFSLQNGVPVLAKKGQVLIFSYLLVHGSYPNVSNRNRRMLLFQLMSADDVPLKAVHLSACLGMVLRGENKNRDADINKRVAQAQVGQA